MGEKIRKDKLVLLPALILLLSTCLYSQTMGNAALSGTVTDPSHAVIPNAKVTVTQQGTGVTRAVSTNAAGVFNVRRCRLQPTRSGSRLLDSRNSWRASRCSPTRLAQ